MQVARRSGADSGEESNHRCKDRFFSDPPTAAFSGLKGKRLSLITAPRNFCQRKFCFTYAHALNHGTDSARLREESHQTCTSSGDVEREGYQLTARSGSFRHTAATARYLLHGFVCTADRLFTRRQRPNAYRFGWVEGQNVDVKGIPRD